MLCWSLSKHLVLFFIFGLEIERLNACHDSYQCRFGQQCCKESNTCQASCSKKHRSNIGVLIGIVAAVAVGNVLFWLTFCCLCWCKGSRKSRFRYRPFAETEDNRESNNVDDVDEDNVDNNSVIHNTIEAANNNDLVINNEDAIIDHHIEDETAKVLETKDEGRTEEISLSIIKIKRPILKTKKNTHLGENCTRHASV